MNQYAVFEFVDAPHVLQGGVALGVGQVVEVGRVELDDLEVPRDVVSDVQLPPAVGEHPHLLALQLDRVLNCDLVVLEVKLENFGGGILGAASFLRVDDQDLVLLAADVRLKRFARRVLDLVEDLARGLAHVARSRHRMHPNLDVENALFFLRDDVPGEDLVEVEVARLCHAVVGGGCGHLENRAEDVIAEGRLGKHPFRLVAEAVEKHLVVALLGGRLCRKDADPTLFVVVAEIELLGLFV